MIGSAMEILTSQPDLWVDALWRHLLLSLLALAISIVIGIVVGAQLTNWPKASFAVVNVANLGRTIPSLAVLAIVYPFVGTGALPAIIALVAMGIPPILLTTFTAVREVGEHERDAAIGMGMTSRERLLQVELPIASPLILSGIRTSAVQIVASATLAALIGGGGLGEVILAGLTNLRFDLLIAGSALVALLAFGTEMAFAGMERVAVPAGIRLSRGSRSGPGYQAGKALGPMAWVVAGGAALAAAGSLVLGGSFVTPLVGTLFERSTATHRTLPTVTIGAGSTRSQELLSEIYTRALRAQGYTVQRGMSSRTSSAAHADVQAGTIDIYPEIGANERVAPLVSDRIASDAGPAFAATVNAVTDAMSTSELRQLSLAAESPDADLVALATGFLKRHDLAKQGPRPTVTVGSKNFTEQFILGELYAQALEARGFPVERRLNLGSVGVADSAIASGQIDVYPEYTGSSLTAALHHDLTPGASSQEVYDEVKAGYAKRGIQLLGATPFSNGNAIVVTKQTAAKYHIKTLSDLAKVADTMELAIVPGFATSTEGLPLLKSEYGMEFKKASSFEIGLKYKALLDGKVNAAYGFETDGQIARHHLVVLKDDRSIWPPYQVAPVVNGSFAKSVGGDFDATINEVNRRLDTKTMQKLNDRVDADKEDPADVAADFLRSEGLS